MRAFCIMPGAIAENIDQSFGCKNSFVIFVVSCRRASRHSRCVQNRRRFIFDAARRWRCQKRIRQFLRSIRFSRNLVRHAHSEFFFESREQFDALKAAESEIAIER